MPGKPGFYRRQAWNMAIQTAADRLKDRGFHQAVLIVLELKVKE